MSSRSTGSLPSRYSAMKRGMSRAGTHEPRYEPLSVRSSATSETAWIVSMRSGCGSPTVTVVPPRRVAA